MGVSHRVMAGRTFQMHETTTSKPICLPASKVFSYVFPCVYAVSAVLTCVAFMVDNCCIHLVVDMTSTVS